jgi:hypothetical protein
MIDAVRSSPASFYEGCFVNTLLNFFFSALSSLFHDPISVLCYCVIKVVQVSFYSSDHKGRDHLLSVPGFAGYLKLRSR